MTHVFSLDNPKGRRLLHTLLGSDLPCNALLSENGLDARYATELGDILAELGYARCAECGVWHWAECLETYTDMFVCGKCLPEMEDWYGTSDDSPDNEDIKYGGGTYGL